MLKLRAEFTDMLVFGQKLLNLRQGVIGIQLKFNYFHDSYFNTMFVISQSYDNQ